MKLIAYGKTNWVKDFPSALEDQAEAKKYVSTSTFLSQMNMDSPATSQVASDPPDEGQDA